MIHRNPVFDLMVLVHKSEFFFSNSRRSSRKNNLIHRRDSGWTHTGSFSIFWYKREMKLFDKPLLKT